MRLAIGIFASLAGASAAVAMEREFTPLVTDHCTVTEIETTGEDGTRLKKSERYPTAWRCKGNGKHFVYVLYGHQREQLAVGNKATERSNYMRHGHFGSWGPTVEWRGHRNGNGELQPIAAIVRYGWNIPQGGADAPAETGGELGVIRLGKGREDTCLFAWVDVTANANALELARDAADLLAAHHVCPKRDDEHSDAAEGAISLGNARAPE